MEGSLKWSNLDKIDFFQHSVGIFKNNEKDIKHNGRIIRGAKYRHKQKQISADRNKRRISNIFQIIQS